MRQTNRPDKHRQFTAYVRVTKMYLPKSNPRIARNLFQQIQPEGSGVISPLIPMKDQDMYLSSAVLAFRYQDSSKASILFIITETDGSGEVEICRLCLPLSWFPFGYVVHQFFPFITKTPENGTPFIELDVNLAEINSPPFRGYFSSMLVIPTWSPPPCMTLGLGVVHPDRIIQQQQQQQQQQQRQQQPPPPPMHHQRPHKFQQQSMTQQMREQIQQPLLPKNTPPPQQQQQENSLFTENSDGEIQLEDLNIYEDYDNQPQQIQKSDVSVPQPNIIHQEAPVNETRFIQNSSLPQRMQNQQNFQQVSDQPNQNSTIQQPLKQSHFSQYQFNPQQNLATNQPPQQPIYPQIHQPQEMNFQQQLQQVPTQQQQIILQQPQPKPQQEQTLLQTPVLQQSQQIYYQPQPAFNPQGPQQQLYPQLPAQAPITQPTQDSEQIIPQQQYPQVQIQEPVQQPISEPDQQAHQAQVPELILQQPNVVSPDTLEQPVYQEPQTIQPNDEHHDNSETEDTDNFNTTNQAQIMLC